MTDVVVEGDTQKNKSSDGRVTKKVSHHKRQRAIPEPASSELPWFPSSVKPPHCLLNQSADHPILSSLLQQSPTRSEGLDQVLPTVSLLHSNQTTSYTTLLASSTNPLAVHSGSANRTAYCPILPALSTKSETVLSRSANQPSQVLSTCPSSTQPDAVLSKSAHQTTYCQITPASSTKPEAFLSGSASQPGQVPCRCPSSTQPECNSRCQGLTNQTDPALTALLQQSPGQSKALDQVLSVTTASQPGQFEAPDQVLSVTSSETPTLKLLRKKIKLLQSQRWKLKREIAHIQAKGCQCKSQMNTIESVVDAAKSFLTPFQLDFFKTQMAASQRKQKGLRWSATIKTFCLQLHHESRAALRLMQKYFAIPTWHTLYNAERVRNMQQSPSEPTEEHGYCCMPQDLCTVEKSLEEYQEEPAET